MTDENINPETLSSDYLIKFFQELINGLAARTEDRLATLEQSQDLIEKQIATLVLGYGEQAVFMEALVAQMAFASDEARKTFHSDLAEARKNMLEVMQDASKGILADESPGVASAVEDLATEKLSNSDS